MLAQLESNPSFQTLRMELKANPGMMVPMLTQLQFSNQALGMLITANMDEFTQWINSAPEIDRSNVIQFTQEEFEVIKRIMELGFGREETMIAFISCDKNEELTVNYLIENKENDPEQDVGEDDDLY